MKRHLQSETNLVPKKVKVDQKLPKMAVSFWAHTCETSIINIPNDVPEIYHNMESLQEGRVIQALWASEAHLPRKLHEATIIATGNNKKELREKEDAHIFAYNEEQAGQKTMLGNKEKKKMLQILKRSKKNEVCELINVDPIKYAACHYGSTHSDVKPVTADNQKFGILEERDGYLVSRKSSVPNNYDEFNQNNDVEVSVNKWSDNECSNSADSFEGHHHENDEVISSLHLMVDTVISAVACGKSRKIILNKLKELKSLISAKLLNSVPSCNGLCTSLSFVGAENLDFLQKLTSVLTNTFAGPAPTLQTLPTMPPMPPLADCDLQGTLSNIYIPGPNKVELTELSGVYIDSQRLNYVLTVCDGETTKLVRAALLLFFTEDEAANMSALGTRDNPAVPARILNAIITFVKLHGKPMKSKSGKRLPLTASVITELVNRKCASFRQKVKTIASIATDKKEVPSKTKQLPKAGKPGLKESQTYSDSQADNVDESDSETVPTELL